MRAFLIATILCPLLLAAQSNAPAALQNHDPEAVVISTADIDLFWKAYDHWAKDLNSAPDKMLEMSAFGKRFSNLAVK